MIGDLKPRIVLCSIQYIDQGKITIDYFAENNYTMFCQWLNPGYYDGFTTPMQDELGFAEYIGEIGGALHIENGKLNAGKRVTKIKDQLYHWSKNNGLLQRKK